MLLFYPFCDYALRVNLKDMMRIYICDECTWTETHSLHSIRINPNGWFIYYDELKSQMKRYIYSAMTEVCLNDGGKFSCEFSY